MTWEATNKRVTPEFFAEHTVSSLLQWSDYELENQGRLTHPMHYDHATDTFRPVEWDDAFARIGTILREFRDPNAVEFYTSGRASNEAAFLFRFLPASTERIISPTARTCAMRRPVSDFRNPSA